MFADGLDSTRATEMCRSSFENKGSFVSVGVISAPKLCHFDGKNCCYLKCDFLDSQGNVRICRRHKNRGGFHLQRSLALPVVPVFNKHSRIKGFLFTVFFFASLLCVCGMRFCGWACAVNIQQRGGF